MDLVAESSRLREVAIKAAMSVDEPLRAAFRSNMDYGYKRDLHDIVTVHDKASEVKISAVIMAEAPDSTIVGEEGGSKGSGAIHWYVDPIDGTANFARGIAHWCVSIAASRDGRVIAGVILDPIARNLFSADLNGAYLNGAPMVSRAFPEESRAVLVSSFPNASHLKAFGRAALDAQAEVVTLYQTVRNLGSAALSLASVAAGWIDATMGFRANAWDVAAGILIVEQAQGRYTGFRQGEAIQPVFMAPDYFAVGKGADYPTLARVVQELSRATPR